MPKHFVSMARLVLAIVAMLATLALASAGRSELALMWTEREDGGLTMLAYGPLDPAQNPLFVLCCFSSDTVIIVLASRGRGSWTIYYRQPITAHPASIATIGYILIAIHPEACYLIRLSGKECHQYRSKVGYVTAPRHVAP